MILGATLLSDRKLYSQLIGIQSLANMEGVDHLYVNIQTGNVDLYRPLFDFLASQKKPYDFDVWDIPMSSHRTVPQFDQDTARLSPIVMSRNMALEKAMHPDFSHILFIDSDVNARPDGLQQLLRANKGLVGGVVPGRGVHRHARYIFGIRRYDNGLIVCDHGTCGYLLITRHIYEIVRFRHGPHPVHRAVYLSEDPAYAADAEYMGFTDGWYIVPEALSEHHDDPGHPLTLEEAYNGYTSVSS